MIMFERLLQIIEQKLNPNDIGDGPCHTSIGEISKRARAILDEIIFEDYHTGVLVFHCPQCNAKCDFISGQYNLKFECFNCGKKLHHTYDTFIDVLRKEHATTDK